jgi:glucosamine-6-phosphate deaminase
MCDVKIINVADYDELALAASDVVTQTVALKPKLTVTFPTGHTPTGLYRHLRAEHAAGRFSLDDADVFMLDEYLDLPSYPEGSFQSFLQDHLGEVVFNKSTTFHPITLGEDVKVCTLYDLEIDLAGGVDLAVVGVGRNGHVGFNEPDAHFFGRTHVVKLATSTLETNFPDQPSSVRPTRAITMGLRDLVAARSVLMLASGSSKSPVLAALRDGDFNPSIPATYFLDHRDFTIIADDEAMALA